LPVPVVVRGSAARMPRNNNGTLRRRMPRVFELRTALYGLWMVTCRAPLPHALPPIPRLAPAAQTRRLYFAAILAACTTACLPPSRGNAPRATAYAFRRTRYFLSPLSPRAHRTAPRAVPAAYACCLPSITFCYSAAYQPRLLPLPRRRPYYRHLYGV